MKIKEEGGTTRAEYTGKISGKKKG